MLFLIIWRNSPVSARAIISLSPVIVDRSMAISLEYLLTESNWANSVWARSLPMLLTLVTQVPRNNSLSIKLWWNKTYASYNYNNDICNYRQFHDATRWEKCDTTALCEVKVPGFHVVPSVIIFSDYHSFISETSEWWSVLGFWINSDSFCSCVGWDFYFCWNFCKANSTCGCWQTD